MKSHIKLYWKTGNILLFWVYVSSEQMMKHKYHYWVLLSRHRLVKIQCFQLCLQVLTSVTNQATGRALICECVAQYRLNEDNHLTNKSTCRCVPGLLWSLKRDMSP